MHFFNHRPLGGPQTVIALLAHGTGSEQITITIRIAETLRMLVG